MVFVGSGLGGVSRFAVGQYFHSRWPVLEFPWPTLTVNWMGSFLLGLLVAIPLIADRQPSSLFLTVGLLGGFTTFSTFSVETVQLFQEGKVGLGALYVVASVLGGLIVACMGFWLTRSLTN